MEEEKQVSSDGVQPQVQEDATAQLQQIIQGGEVAQAQVQSVEPVKAQAAVEYAGFWVRFAANLVDGLVLVIPSMIVNLIFGDDLGVFMGYVLMWAYAIYMLNTKQATLGKMAVGLMVTTVDGGKPTVGKLALREIVGKILNIVTLFIGYIMIAFTAKKQGLHDMIADTVVVYDPARKRRGWIVILGIVFALIIPILGIFAGVVLVSMNSARDKAQEKANEARQKAQAIEVQLQQDQLQK